MSCREWKEVKLGEVCDVTSSKRIFAKEYVQSGIPFYRGKEIIEKHNGANISTKLFISGEKYEEIKRTFGVPTVGDILLTSVGTLGIPYIVKNEKFYFKDGNLTWIKDFKQNMYNKFLNYWLISPLGKLQISHKTIGSTQQALTIRAIKSFVINLPPLPEQKAIAATLSCLDDMIELNNHTNQVLEEMAQAIFKHWFVDFEFPNKDGQPYKSSGGAMFDSEMGEIPQGWGVLQFADFLNIRNERTAELEVAEYSVTNTGIFPRNEKFRKQLSASKSKNKIIRKYDLVFGMSRAILNWGLMKELIGGVSSAYNVFASDTNKIDPLFLELFMIFKIDYFMDIIKPASREGQGIDKNVLLKKNIYIPDKNLLLQYHKTTKIIDEYTNSLRNETETLTSIRDTLLPKLMSGKIRVPIEEVV